MYRRPGQHLGALDLARQRGQAEVGDARAAATVEHDVARLEIAVQDAELVRRGEPGAELARDLRRLLGRQPADATEQRGQVLAVDDSIEKKCCPWASPTSNTRQTLGCEISASV